METTKFSLPTPQAARVAKVKAHVLYAAHHRFGNWEGVVPRKLPNGRLLWPRAELLRAAGIVKAASGEDADCRRLVEFAEINGVPVDDSSLALMAALVNTLPDLGRDPDYMADETVAVMDIVFGHTSRLDASWSALEQHTQRKITAALRLIVGSLSAYAGVAA